jgi:hypothetical protein
MLPRHVQVASAERCLPVCLLCLLLQHDDPWKVRILPRVAFGVRHMGDEPSMRPDSPGVVVLHHFMSSWQTARRRSLIQVLLSRDRWVRAGHIVVPAGSVSSRNDAVSQKQMADQICGMPAQHHAQYACSIKAITLVDSPGDNWCRPMIPMLGLVWMYVTVLVLQANADAGDGGASAGQQHHPLPSQHRV